MEDYTSYKVRLALHPDSPEANRVEDALKTSTDFWNFMYTATAGVAMRYMRSSQEESKAREAQLIDTFTWVYQRAILGERLDHRGGYVGPEVMERWRGQLENIKKLATSVHLNRMTDMISAYRRAYAAKGKGDQKHVVPRIKGGTAAQSIRFDQGDFIFNPGKWEITIPSLRLVFAPPAIMIDHDDIKTITLTRRWNGKLDSPGARDITKNPVVATIWVVNANQKHVEVK